MDMSDSLERNTAASVQDINPAEVIILDKSKKEIVIKNSIFLAFILIPILSVEGLISWSIGGIGLYKAVNIYRSEELSKAKKSIRVLAICLAIAIAYNLAVHYITKIAVALTV